VQRSSSKGEEESRGIHLVVVQMRALPYERNGGQLPKPSTTKVLRVQGGQIIK
jgi:hypothetical protein